MSIQGVLNRAYHNNKQSIQYDHGGGLNPGGFIDSTYYHAVARIKQAIKFNTAISGGRLVEITLENHPYPPGDPTYNSDADKQNPLGLSENGISTSRTGLPDYVSIAGLPGSVSSPESKMDGEHTISNLSVVGGSRSGKVFLLLDNVNTPNPGLSDITISNQGWIYLAQLSLPGLPLMDPARVISHPSFVQREGEGIYTYPYPPDITRNFVYHPTGKIDGTMTRTLSSNVFVTQPQLDEDIVISEIWLGSDGTLSTLSEMFRVFYQYWTTVPDAGEIIGWEPRDRTGDRFGIQIVRVLLGGLDFEYNEVRQIVNDRRDSFLNRQLTLQFKLARRSVPSIPQISLEGN